MGSLDDVAIFVEIVEQGSFHAAAHRVGLSEGAVSKRLGALETRLRVELLQRSTRSHRLTPAGEQFYEAVRHLPRELAEAEERLMERGGRVEGPLRVVMPTWLHSLAARAVPAFLATYPEVRLTLDLVVDPFSTPPPFDLLFAGRLPGVPFPDSDLVGRQILKLRGALFAAPEYLARHGVPNHPRDLEQHQCLGHTNPLWRFTEPDGTPFFFTSKGPLFTNSTYVLVAATLAGQGVAYSFPEFFEEDLRAGRVIPFLESFTRHSYVEVFVFRPPSRFQPRRVAAFLEVFQQEMLS